MKIILSVRPITFGKVTQSSIVYNFLYYAGHEPAKILLERLNFSIRRQLRGTTAISELNSFQTEHLLIRIRQLIEFLSNPKGRLYRFVNAICGNSKRKALVVAQSLFVNNQIPFTEPLTKEDQFIQTITSDASLQLSKSNPFVLNLFTGSSSTNSFLKIRIIQLLLLNSRTAKRPTRISELISFIQFFDGYSTGEIYEVIDEMIDEKKGLIYIPAVIEYKSIEEFARSSNDYILVTQTGTRYLSQLIVDLQYLQNCFYTIDWSIRKIEENKTNLEDFLGVIIDTTPHESVRSLCQLNLNLIKGGKVRLADFLPMEQVDVSNFIERIMYVRACLQILLLEDVCELIRYIDNEAHGSYRVKELITETMIVSIHQSVRNISSSMQSYGIEEELNEWESLKLMAQNWNQIIHDQLEVL